jgi:hypothetical protein
LYAPVLSDSDDRMDAHRCWAGTRSGGAAGDLCDSESSEKARRVACNRGGMVVAVGVVLRVVVLVRVMLEAEILGCQDALMHSRGLFRFRDGGLSAPSPDVLLDMAMQHVINFDGFLLD